MSDSPLPSTRSGNHVRATGAPAERVGAAPVEAEAARHERASQRLALFAAGPVLRLGIARYLQIATPMVIAEAASPEELEQILSANAISAIVADARDHALVSAVGREHAIPILLVASSLLDGLIAATHAGNAGIVVTSDNLAPTLAAALNAVISGQPYRSPVLQTPFAGFDLTPREQRLLVLEAQNCPIQAMAKHLGVAVTTVSQYRQRLRIKLGLDQADELAEWARTYLQTRARTGGD